MKINNPVFVKSAVKPKDYPSYEYPEFAFLGRSNAGKSSLINMLLNRKDLVKTGAKPGVTRLVNFFLIDETFSIADLPGYGYAKLPMEMRKTFLPMIREYIRSRKNLKVAFLLMDIRRVPDDFDHDLIHFILDSKVQLALVLTKCDKLSRNERRKNIAVIQEALDVDMDSIFLTSSKTGEGKREIHAVFAEYK